MTDRQMPPTPEGCVYGPWWDDASQWLAIVDDRYGRWLAIYDHEGWGLYDPDLYESTAYVLPQLLRLAKQNTELMAEVKRLEDVIEKGNAEWRINAE